jgi:thiol:disulfide interchange protein DsbD
VSPADTVAKDTKPHSEEKSKLDPNAPVWIEEPIITDRPPAIVHDEGFETDIEVFEDVVFTVPVRVNPNLSPLTKELAITFVINSQVCQNVCKRVDVKLNATLEIVKDSSPISTAITPGNSPSNGNSTHSEGLFAFLLAAAGAGLVSLLTPCVFPMIPITVSFFTKRKHISHARAIRDALIFSGGIIFTYVGVAFVVQLAFGKNVRDLATNPYANLVIFTIFLAMAGSLFGFYDIQIPASWVNKLNKSAHGGDSVFGLLVMGLVFTMTSFSCTGPFVGTIMIEALKGGWMRPMLGMTVYATMFALPFFLLALFPSALKSLPKSGGWLNSVKVVMGFIEIAAALKFLSNADLTWTWGVLTYEVFLILWSLLALGTGIYLLGKIRFPHDTPVKKYSTMRIGLATLFLATGCYLVVAAFGKAPLGIMTAYVPPNPYPVRLTDTWEDGLAAAKKSQKPIFFDFTGITCTNCRRMESNMFKRDVIRKLMDKFVVVQLYTDVGKTPEQVIAKEKNSKVQSERFDNETLPFYVIVTPDDKVLAQFDKGYTEDTDEFKAFLQKGLLVQAVKETPDWQSGLAVARKEGKPMFFNFENGCESALVKTEAESFKRIKVDELKVDDLLKNFIRLDVQNCAHDEREAPAASDPLKAAVNPFYAIVARDGNVLADIDKAEFLRDATETPAVTNFKRFMLKAIATPAAPVPNAQSAQAGIPRTQTAQN